jgi:hypothetical protein
MGLKGISKLRRAGLMRRSLFCQYWMVSNEVKQLTIEGRQSEWPEG